MTAQKLTLFGMWRSGPTYKVGLALSLMGLPFSYVHVSLMDGEHKTPDFLKKNRFGQVPCLVDGSRALCQSASILEYLAAKSGKFGGATEDEVIMIREWMFWDFDRLAVNIYRPRAIKAGFRQAGAQVLDLHMSEGANALLILDKSLSDKEWLVNNKPTIADIDIYGVVSYAAQGDFDLSPYENILAWIERFEKLPGFKTAEDLLPRETRL